MIFPNDFPARIGFARVARAVEEMATTEAGRQRIRHAHFSTDRDHIQTNLDRLAELKGILLLHGGIPDSGYSDLLAIDAVLRTEDLAATEAQLAELRRALITVRALVRAFRDVAPGGHLLRLCAGYEWPEGVLPILRRVLGDDGLVRDEASDELFRVRRELRRRDGKVTSLLNSILAEGQREGYLPADARVAVRDGQTLIPIPAGAKGKIAAVVQGHSRGGQTLFVAPYAVLELQAEIRALREEESAELARILLEVTDALRDEREPIRACGELLVEVDVLRAKAQYAVRVGGGKPILVGERRLYLRGANHPRLLEKMREAGQAPVPLDIRLDEGKRLLVISGPNAGGKSVCLKTVGTAVYMLQCGFLPLVKENSEMGIFDSLLLDIGDAQSMEDELSTYSSHLLAMREILAHATPRSLVLIDELGSGTEPVAGGAIAEAVLGELAAGGALGVVTTHYGNLKQLAMRTDGLHNGSMAYDAEGMRPFYRLEMGVPGSSFAFEIAQRMGLPATLIARAEELAGAEYVSLEEQLRAASADRLAWEAKRREIEEASRTVDRLRAQLAEATGELSAQRRAIVSEARSEAKRIVREANRTVENTIRTIREAHAEKEATRAARSSLEQAKRDIERAEREDDRAHGKLVADAGKKSEKPDASATTLTEGMRVRLVGSDTVGEVVKLSGKRAMVRMGQMMTSVEVARLEPVGRDAYRRLSRGESSGGAGSLAARQARFRPDIDVRGMRGDEAIRELEAQLDSALILGTKQCRVLHGKGDGILRKLIREYLQRAPQVESFRDEHPHQGGAGITIYELR